MKFIKNEEYDKNLLEYKKILDSKLSIFKDPNFKFDELSHVYKYSNKKFDSVTTILKVFKEPFNKDYWSKQKAKERGVDPSIILNEWDEKSKTSMDLGTKVHKFIEDFLSGLGPEIIEGEDPIYDDRVKKFMDVYEKRIKYLLPLESELRIFCKKWRLAGTIDQPFLYLNPKTGKFIIIIGDWKTNGDFTHDTHPKGKYGKLLRPFNWLYQNNLNEYSIQISMYRLILQEEIGLETEDGFLCHIGPNGPAKIYKCKDLREPLKHYLDHNRSELDIFEME
jgi:hypothetical protein